MELPIRKGKILNAIIKQYIETGEPMGSKLLLDFLDFSVSSATVRNEMASLSEMGYLIQPHTSAGRVPTQLGYRYYLDHLVEPIQLSDRECRAIDDVLIAVADDPEHILNKGAEILSQLTGYVAVSTTPPANDTTIERVKILQISRHTVMIVMITSKGMVKNRLFRCDHNITNDVLSIFERALNEMLTGVKLSLITPAFVQTVAIALGDVLIFMPQALLAIMDAAKEASVINIVNYGLSNLLQTGEFSVEQLRNIYRFLQDVQLQEELLLRKHDRISTYIGTESKIPDVFSTGIVVSRYSIQGTESGALGVIGPVRMNYTKVIAYTDYISQMCGKLITELLE
ncbi:MAG: heat-inducible transcriptional repressor HrcA [Acutalibacteraceae bacterium]|nr:heat-inducible transcriptional repressor HrcA [Acutalibacteraceae bacterium]